MTLEQTRLTKVAIVVPTHWSFLMGGAQLQAKLLLEELVSRDGIEVSYLASRVGPNTVPPNSYALTQIAVPGPLHRYGLFWDYFALQRRLSEYQPDLIYQRVAGSYTGICARYAKRHSIPLAWHVANSTDCDPNRVSLASLRRPHAYLERALEQYGRNNADLIVVQNADQKAQLRANFGKQNTHLIPNFHPVPETAAKPTPKPLCVLWIANLKDSKRPEAMVEVARHLSHLPEIEFTMIGAPYPSVEYNKQKAFEDSISALPNVTYAGEQSLDAVNSLLERSHVLVNTSIKEGFSNTFIQAWLRQVSVLTLGINPDNILNGGSLGQSFTSTKELADALEARSKQPERLERDGLDARRIAIRDFSLDNVRKLADLLLSQCSDR